jgi:hypothetical protein
MVFHVACYLPETLQIIVFLEYGVNVGRAIVYGTSLFSCQPITVNWFVCVNIWAIFSLGISRSGKGTQTAWDSVSQSFDNRGPLHRRSARTRE